MITPECICSIRPRYGLPPKQLLAVKTLPGAARIIPPAVMAQLQERLQDPSGFDSYKAIVQWLRQEHQLEVAYPTVHRIVRNVVPVFAPEVNPIERLWQHLRAA
ncbi:helix-turn-helix domain-containing protein [Thermosynechococcus sp. QS41]|uniref:helix-turn-helix domain-containing protein n=1 Tax=Thermosynechococcus sp. QS41 TaxID=3074101 RepID=UPI002877CA85|nr:helix-turn-helix domain-containing protein [Thermosynechococcus sp. QS41]WNC60499.1 helix-turn-helix domain-containing protein [Thermosynechococcus sp. QS41]